VGGRGNRVLTVAWPEMCTGAEQLTVAEARQSFPQHGIGDDQRGAGGHSAVNVHWRLELPPLVHCLATEPEETLPPPSRTRPVARLAMV
jgi:hypothetical protein